MTHRPPTGPPATATIYRFPVRTRVARAVQPTTSDDRPRLPAAECGSGWYHDVAIQEADRARTH